MLVKRTKRLSLKRALQILQLRFGTQVKNVSKCNNIIIANSICGYKRNFTKEDILKIEDEMYSSFGC